MNPTQAKTAPNVPSNNYTNNRRQDQPHLEVGEEEDRIPISRSEILNTNLSLARILARLQQIPPIMRLSTNLNNHPILVRVVILELVLISLAGEVLVLLV